MASSYRPASPPLTGLPSAAEHLSAPLAAVAMALLGILLGRNHGLYHPVAAALLVPFLLMLAALQTPPVRRSALPRDAATLIAFAALALQMGMLISGRLGVGLDPYRDGLLVPLGLPVVAIFVAALLGTVGRGGKRGRFVAAIAMPCAFGVFAGRILHEQPAPMIDVMVFQDEGSAALVHGRDPYAVRMPNLYGWPTAYYAREVVDGDRLKFGYPYPPLPLLSVVPTWLITGDIRYAHVVALTATLGILTLLPAGPWALLAGALLVLLPELPRVFVNGWTEPLMLPWLALTACAMRTRRPYAAAVTFGLFLASKQTAVIFLPLLWYVVPDGAPPRSAVKIILVALATAAVVTVPFALWDPPAFWRSVVMCQVLQPFRSDGLTFAAWWEHRTGASTLVEHAAALLGFAVLVPAYALIAVCGRRTPANLGLAIAFIGTLFFAFNKQAFLNYYSLVAGALAIGLAHLPAHERDDRPADDSTPALTPG